MQSGTTNVSGTLDASAPNGGDGGFIETSAARVDVAEGAAITTAAPAGRTGSWLIDPQDFIISATGGNISGATLSAQLVTNSVTITTTPGSNATAPGTPPVDSIHTATPGNGDIFVNDAVAWVAAPSTTTLTLNASRDVNVNAPVSATNGNIVICCGRDANVNAAITTVRGSVLITAGHDVNVNGATINPLNPGLVGVITTTDGNITLCAGLDIYIDGAITLTRGTTIPARSLGLPVGLVMIAGAGGTGPGIAGGTVIFAPLAPAATVTVAPVIINYNPVSYTTPNDYSTKFTLTEGAILTQHMLVLPSASRMFDGTTDAILDGFNSTAISGLPTGVTLVAGPNATATFDDPAVSASTGITFSGYTVGGPNASQYAFAGGTCCVATFRTTGVISAAGAPPAVVPPVVTPPVVTPPVFVPPVVAPPVVVPPVVAPPVVAPPVVVPPVVTPPVVVLPVVAPPVVAPPVVVPPVVTPPVVVPPVVTPPVVVPPVVAPPVVAPPVVVPPVITPPVVVPPVVTPPVVTPPVVTPPVITPPAMPLAPVASPPSGAMLVIESITAMTAPAAAAGIQLATIGEGLRMPADTMAQTITVASIEVARAPQIALPVLRAPEYAPKQDRH